MAQNGTSGPWTIMLRYAAPKWQEHKNIVHWSFRLQAWKGQGHQGYHNTCTLIIYIIWYIYMYIRTLYIYVLYCICMYMYNALHIMNMLKLPKTFLTRWKPSRVPGRNPSADWRVAPWSVTQSPATWWPPGGASALEKVGFQPWNRAL